MHCFFDVNMFEAVKFFCRQEFSGEFSIHVLDVYNRYINEDIAKKLNITLYNNFDNDLLTICRESDYIFCSFYQDIEHVLDILENNKARIINLWHGFPIRNICAMSPLEATYAHKTLYHPQKLCVHHIVSSEFYRQHFVKAFLTSIENVHIYGNIRRDMICNKNPDTDSYIKEISRDVVYDKIILFCPTHSIVMGQNVLPWDNYEINIFNEFLVKNNILFLFKVHDAGGIDHHISDAATNIKEINSADLLQHGLFTQNLFQYADILITNASSVITDFILLNRSVIFTDVPENYKKDNGFISDKFFKIGPIVKNQEELIFTIKETLKQDNFKEQRKELMDMLYKYTDSNTLKRIYKLIK